MRDGVNPESASLPPDVATQASIAFKTTAPPEHVPRGVGPGAKEPDPRAVDFGSPSACRAINAAGRAVALDQELLIIDAEVSVEGQEDQVWGGKKIK